MQKLPDFRNLVCAVCNRVVDAVSWVTLPPGHTIRVVAECHGSTEKSDLRMVDLEHGHVTLGRAFEAERLAVMRPPARLFDEGRMSGLVEEL